MGYPYDGLSEYSDDEIRQMEANGDISSDEARHLSSVSGGSYGGSSYSSDDDNPQSYFHDD